MSRELDNRFDSMRETLNDTINVALVGVATTLADAIKTQTQDLSATLTSFNPNAELMTALRDLKASFSEQKSALAVIQDTMRERSMTGTDDTTRRDNVIPPEMDGTDTGTPGSTARAPTPATSVGTRASDIAGGDDASMEERHAGDTTAIETNPVDVTAHSALANMEMEQSLADSQPARANSAWRATYDARASALGMTLPSVTPYRPPPDYPRTRTPALGATASHLTQTLVPDHFPPRPTVTTSATDTGPHRGPTTYSLMVDTETDTTDDRTWHGGMIRSPRYIDRRKLAIERKVHPSNIESLAADEYHGGPQGRTTIDMPFVHACGYQTSISGPDVVTAYSDIILLHAFTVERWQNARTQQTGPQLERIIEKGLTTLPRLHGLAMEEIIDFYDKLQPVSALYLLPIVPFDCINVTMGYEALCPPGLGTRRYATIGRVLIEVLPRILPKLHSQVNTIITMVRQESNNGYDLLWRILELGVPGFDPSVPIRVPVWKDDDIFDFAAAFCLYYRLLAKKGMQYDDRSRSVTFLQAITAPAYIDAANTILINVHNFFGSEFDASLPPALCIMGIANQLHEQAVKRSAAIVPRARRLAYTTDDDYDDLPDYPSASRMDGNRRWSDRPAPPDRQPRYERGYRDDTRSDRNDRGGDGNSGRPGRGAPRPLVQGSRGPARQQNPRGRYVRPDRNRGAYLPDIICDACRRPGHVAATCDVLAMALFIEKYKRDISSDLKDKLERDWVSRWKETVGSNKPRRVMKTYVDHLDISVDDLDDLLCWDCWPDNEPETEGADDDPAGSA